MKRLHPNDRKRIVDKLYDRLSQDLLCHYGEWNRNKLLDELRSKIKNNKK